MSGQFHNPIKSRKKSQNQYNGRSLSWAGTGNSIKNSEAKLVI